MKKVIVIGIPGAGKSTFARELGERTQLPVHHLDRYFWNPGWKASSPEVFDAQLRKLMATDEWILDGNYRRTIPLRLQYADTAIYMDLPRHTALRRVFQRIVTYRNGGRPDMAEGCNERWFDRDFLRYIWRFHRDVHPEIMRHLRVFEQKGSGTVVHLRGDREAAEWLRSLDHHQGR